MSPQEERAAINLRWQAIDRELEALDGRSSSLSEADYEEHRGRLLGEQDELEYRLGEMYLQEGGSVGGSLCGYGFRIHQRDRFRCRYCGLDGSKWPTWLYLAVDHLLPKNHPNCNNPLFQVTACRFCNEADNHFFEKAAARGLRFDGLTPEELVEQRRPFVTSVRGAYRRFWQEHVCRSATTCSHPEPA